MCRRILCFRLPFHSCNIPVDFVERFVCFVTWKNIVYCGTSAVFKNQSIVFFSAKTIAATRFIMIVVLGTSVNCLWVNFLLERSKKKL